MVKLPRVSGKEMLRFLERKGFSVLCNRGSHQFLDRGDTDDVVPVHVDCPPAAGTLRKILRGIDITPAEFADRLKRQPVVRPKQKWEQTVTVDRSRHFSPRRRPIFSP